MTLGGVPAYTWQAKGAELRGVVVTMHGLMMHGKTFDTAACQLARRGLMVVAPDLRGFGRWHFNPELGEETRVDYRRSVHDLNDLFDSLFKNFSGLPLFCVGESLGAHLARKLVVMHPEMISGLILSSP